MGQRWELQPDGTWANDAGISLPHDAFPEPVEGQDAWLINVAQFETDRPALVDIAEEQRIPICVHDHCGYPVTDCILPDRTRDHCTTEERAVIDLALQYHELRLMQSGTTRTLATLVAAVDALLAARKER